MSRSSVLIIVTVHRPNLNYLNAQLVSIAQQTSADFKCVVASDGKLDESSHRYFNELNLDDRFRLLEFDDHVGLYRHIERLLREEMWGFKYLALSDQDDVWDAGRLTTQITILDNGCASMVTSNARLIDGVGNDMCSTTLFAALRISNRALRYGMIANQASGSGSLYRIADLDGALPFPPKLGVEFHDHWLFLIALLNGGCHLDFKCSWGYRQHQNNVVGVVSGSTFRKSLLVMIRKLSDIIRHWSDPKSDTHTLQLVANIQTILQRVVAEPNNQFLAQLKMTRWRAISLLSPSAAYFSRLESIRLWAHLTFVRNSVSQVMTPNQADVDLSKRKRQ